MPPWSFASHTLQSKLTTRNIWNFTSFFPFASTQMLPLKKMYFLSRLTSWWSCEFLHLFFSLTQNMPYYMAFVWSYVVAFTISYFAPVKTLQCIKKIHYVISPVIAVLHLICLYMSCSI